MYKIWTCSKEWQQDLEWFSTCKDLIYVHSNNFEEYAGEVQEYNFITQGLIPQHRDHDELKPRVGHPTDCTTQASLLSAFDNNYHSLPAN